jgi:hypothetical protein
VFVLDAVPKTAVRYMEIFQVWQTSALLLLGVVDVLCKVSDLMSCVFCASGGGNADAGSDACAVLVLPHLGFWIERGMRPFGCRLIVTCCRACILTDAWLNIG